MTTGPNTKQRLRPPTRFQTTDSTKPGVHQTVRETGSAPVAIALGHTDGGELVRKLYGHRDHERALDRVTAAYESTANFTQMRLV